MPIDQAKLAKLQAASAANRTGGKGTPRRKVQAKKGAAGEDKKLQAALKKLNVQPVSGIDEVNMFKEDGNVLHFKAPKVHGVGGTSNTFAVYGQGADKELTELVPGILSQLGPDSLASLRKLAESYQAMNAAHMAAQQQGGQGDDEVPDVPTNFDEAEGEAKADAEGEAKKEGEPEVDKLD